MTALSKRLEGKVAVIPGGHGGIGIASGRSPSHFSKAFSKLAAAHSHEEESPLKGKHVTPSDRDIVFEDFAAELTVAAYSVALRHGVGDKWLDLELELWRVLTETVKKREREWHRAAGEPEAAHGEGRD